MSFAIGIYCIDTLFGFTFFQSCRKCEDCGSNVPGSGPSCRWHFNYTVCDKCYQQRKKGTMPCCPMCGKAVRSSSGEFSRQCMKCGTLVHCRCDKNASNEGVNYVCPNCRHDNSDEDSEMPSFMVCPTVCCLHICFLLS